MNTLFCVNNVTCGYKSGFRIQNISLGVEEGSFVGVVGPNGSGKTTLFRAISGDLKLLSGDILLQGESIVSMPLRERAKQIAIVSQFIEMSNITVEEYVLMGRVPYRDKFQFMDKKEDIEIARHYMNMTDIYHLRNSRMSELSGGEQQMVAIASALSQQPILLLLDEPTSHLDITHQIRFMNLVEQLNQELRLSVIMIIHDLNMAAEYCSSLVMMKNGQVITQGRPEEVLTYQNIESIYDTVVVVGKNPISGKAVVFPVSQRNIKEVSR